VYDLHSGGCVGWRSMDRALQLVPKHGLACAQLGGLYLNHIPGMESLDKAEHLLKQATQLETLDTQQAYFDLGQVYSEKSRFKEAADAYRNEIKNGGIMKRNSTPWRTRAAVQVIRRPQQPPP
jgi:hypothetical protein